MSPQQMIEEAVLEFQRDNLAASRNIFLKLLEENPRSEEALYGLAICEYKSGEVSSALTILATLIEMNSDVVEVYHLAATILLENNDYENAKLLFETALEKEPDFTDARRSYGQLMLFMKQKEKGVGILLDLLNNNPEDIQTLMVLGQYYQNLGNPDAARFYLTKVLLLDPDHVPAQELYNKLSKD